MWGSSSLGVVHTRARHRRGSLQRECPDGEYLTQDMAILLDTWCAEIAAERVSTHSRWPLSRPTTILFGSRGCHATAVAGELKPHTAAGSSLPRIVHDDAAVARDRSYEGGVAGARCDVQYVMRMLYTGREYWHTRSFDVPPFYGRIVTS